MVHGRTKAGSGQVCLRVLSIIRFQKREAIRPEHDRRLPFFAGKTSYTGGFLSVLIKVNGSGQAKSKMRQKRQLGTIAKPFT